MITVFCLICFDHIIKFHVFIFSPVGIIFDTLFISPQDLEFYVRFICFANGSVRLAEGWQMFSRFHDMNTVV